MQERNGPPLGRLNMEAWVVRVRCGGDCSRTDITLAAGAGRADLLVVASQARLDLAQYCFSCNSHWTGRLLPGQTARWATAVPGRAFRQA